MGQAKKRGTRSERINKAMQDMEPSQFFGFNRERKADESPFALNEDGLVCMVLRITNENQNGVNSESGREFKIGDWMCSTGAHESTVVHGPFKSVEDAFEFARLEVGAIRFVNPPVWDF